ncbi:MAG: imidazole glycerol phosphate synthase subunit HisH [Capsulimonadales bacterium]|nr:imidazole glycerol phosphate synthase subunit HisH [Capsulimonadales bacterium]
MPSIAIIDYGVGNLRSVGKAFEAAGHPACITRDPSVIRAASHVVLPGVGAFGAAAATLRSVGLEPVALEAARSGKPFLGICVGMQLLFTESEEMGVYRGLDLIPGRVLRFHETNLGPAACGVKVPQIGWNGLSFVRPDCPLFAGLDEGAMVYFVHSFYCAPSDPDAVAATTDYIAPYCSVVASGNLFGVQFHPEKSSAVGLKLLDNFARLNV